MATSEKGVERKDMSSRKSSKNWRSEPRWQPGGKVSFLQALPFLYSLPPWKLWLGCALLYWTIYRGFPIAIFHYQRVHVERQPVLIQHNTVWSQSNSISINSEYNHPFQAVSGFTFWHPWWDLFSISSNPLRGWNRLRFKADTGYPRNRLLPIPQVQETG